VGAELKKTREITYKEVQSIRDPAKRFKDIATKRKLLDLAKTQTDEIEFLRDELDRLRAKTFPSFAHMSQKQD